MWLNVMVSFGLPYFVGRLLWYTCQLLDIISFIWYLVLVLGAASQRVPLTFCSEYMSVLRFLEQICD